MSAMSELRMWRARRSAFSLRRRIRFYDKMERFTRNGRPVTSTIRSFHARYVKYKDPRAPLFLTLVSRLESGEHLSEGLAPYIPAGERQLIQAGEESGKIHIGFREARKLALALRAIRSAMIRELIYPVMLVGMLALLLVGTSIKLVPVIEKVVPFESWPGYAQPLKLVSDAVVTQGVFWLIGLGIVAFVAMRSLPRWTGPARERLDRWCPPWSVYRDIQGASFLIALSSLTASGVAVTKAIDRLSVTCSEWLRVHLKRMSRKLMTGANPGESMRTGLFDREIEDDIEDFTSDATFEDALQFVGSEQVEDVVQRIGQRAAGARLLLLLMVVGVLLYVYTAAVMVVMGFATSQMQNVPM